MDDLTHTGESQTSSKLNLLPVTKFNIKKPTSCVVTWLRGINKPFRDFLWWSNAQLNSQGIRKDACIAYLREANDQKAMDQIVLVDDCTTKSEDACAVRHTPFLPCQRHIYRHSAVLGDTVALVANGSVLHLRLQRHRRRVLHAKLQRHRRRHVLLQVEKVASLSPPRTPKLATCESGPST